MLDNDKTASESPEAGSPGTGSTESAPQDAPAPVVKKTTRKAAAKRTTKKAAAAPEPVAEPVEESAAEAEAPVEKPVRKTTRKAAAKRTTKKAAAAPEPVAEPAEEPAAEAEAPVEKPVKKTTRKAAAKRTTKKAAAAPEPVAEPAEAPAAEAEAPVEEPAGPAVLFQAPVATKTRRTRKSAAKKVVPAAEDEDAPAEDAPAEESPADAQVEESQVAATSEETSGSTGDEATAEDTAGDEDGDSTPARRRRRRGGRRRRKSSDSADSADGQGEGEQGEAKQESGDDSAEATTDESSDKADNKNASETSGEGGSSRRRRRRRRAGDDSGSTDSDDPNTVTKIRQGRSAEDQITAVTGSTRLEAKKQRRREGREAGRRRAPIVSEAEFLARREAVERVMVIRQREDLTQIAVLEDKVLVEHYVARESQTSLIGNIYLGRVQNVLPSMEAAFIDIGKGRNAVLYAGEVNWSALGHKEGQPRKIESVLQSGQTVLVQVTKDPIGQKGARLTSQISLAGRFLVYVPDGTTSGISRKLPDTERNRLKTLLKEIVPDSAGVIVRTAAEGASEEELTRDVERLKARWEDIEKKASGKGGGVQLLYGEPDLTLKVVRDLFTEDFTKLVIEGADAWDTVHGYVSHVAPDLADRLERFEPATEGNAVGKDVFAAHRIEEQIHKGLDRKVWLPSGGSLIIDRTEAMTVVDVNTGKFTGSGGNLEETVTKNNLEAAEEIVRQLRLRDIGGIIVVDFIDMVLESNRDLVLRRLVECLGRDRTRHQVAEVTSLGLVQMTRKRIGTGLLEAFSENCEHCQGRGVVIKDAPIEPAKSDDDGGRRGRRGRGRRGGSDNSSQQDSATPAPTPSPADVAAMARPEKPSEDAAAEEAPEAPEAAAAQETVVEEKPAADEKPVADKPAADEKPAVDEKPAANEKPVADQEPPAVDSSPQEDVRPAVVSRTRRRSATRPAGPPPVVEAPVVEVPAVDVAESGQVAEAPAPVVTHVPIKKRGTRKR